MLLRVLGCSGGIGGNLRTTALLVDHDVLIDAGTGVADLSLDELVQIDHIFVTHSHLDHIACIPFLVDSVGGMRDRPLTVYALPETIQCLKDHIFNWKIWPDFGAIPSPETPFLRLVAMELGGRVTLGDRVIRSVPANHVVPAVGYHLDSGRSSLVFTGDTTSNDALWEEVNGIENLKYLIIETAFSNAEAQLAALSKHLCPALLTAELAKLRRPARIFVTHLKPGEGAVTMSEIEESAEQYSPRMLSNGQVLKF